MLSSQAGLFIRIRISGASLATPATVVGSAPYAMPPSAAAVEMVNGIRADKTCKQRARKKADSGPHPGPVGTRVEAGSEG